MKVNGCEYQECESGAIEFFSIPGESATAVLQRESTFDDDRAGFVVRVGIGAPQTNCGAPLLRVFGAMPAADRNNEALVDIWNEAGGTGGDIART